MNGSEFLKEVKLMNRHYESGDIFPINRICLSGKVVEEPKKIPIHNFHSYSATLYIQRKNKENGDFAEIVIPQNLIYPELFSKNKIQVIGKLRTTFIDDHLKYYVKAERVGYEYNEDDINWLLIEGRVAKTPEFKTTPRGFDVCLINMKTFNYDLRRRQYMPCVTFGEKAIDAKYLNIWSKIRILGRLQSRDYFDRKDQTQRRASEISIFRLQEIYS